MMKRKYILSAFVAVLLASSMSVAQEHSWDNASIYEFREILRLKDKGMSIRSSAVLDDLACRTGKADPLALSVLEEITMQVPGYMIRMNEFVAAHPYSPYVPQMYYACASNLFDADDYDQAIVYLDMVKLKHLYKDQRDGYLFKKAYCELETGDMDRALLQFLDLTARPVSDFTAPAKYSIAYINYDRGNYQEALQWFERTADDRRFAEVSDYYIMECRFLLKDYKYVAKYGEKVYERMSEERRPFLARIVSESFLVLGDPSKAREYYDLSVNAVNQEYTRTDWFYSGSVLYAVQDYKGAIDNFTRMGERNDSIGQIASYNLGYSYIQTKDKVSAMGAFQEASQLKYDSAIAEDAYFNYAKLAFDLNSDITGFKNYLLLYPQSGKEEQIYSYMAIAALYEHDYERAIDAYDKIDDLDENIRIAPSVPTLEEMDHAVDVIISAVKQARMERVLLKKHNIKEID